MFRLLTTAAAVVALVLTGTGAAQASSADRPLAVQQQDTKDFTLQVPASGAHPAVLVRCQLIVTHLIGELLSQTEAHFDCGGYPIYQLNMIVAVAENQGEEFYGIKTGATPAGSNVLSYNLLSGVVDAVCGADYEAVAQVYFKLYAEDIVHYIDGATSPVIFC